MSAPPSKSMQPTPMTFNERINEQLINCLTVQTNVIQNLAQYSQHISLQLFEIKSIVEILSNRVLALQQQQCHYPPSSYAASYYPNYMPQHSVLVPHQPPPPPPSHPPSGPFSVPQQQLPVQTRLPTTHTATPSHVNFPFAPSNPLNPLYHQLQQQPPPSSLQPTSTSMPSFPFSTSMSNPLTTTTTTPNQASFPIAPKMTVPEQTTKPTASSFPIPTTTTTSSSLFQTATTTSSSSLFSTPSTTSSSLFPTATTTTSPSSFFPTATTTTSPSSFFPTATTTTSSSSLFSMPATTTTTSSLFPMPLPATTTTTSSLFPMPLPTTATKDEKPTTSTGFSFGTGSFVSSLPHLSTPKQEPNADEEADENDEDTHYEPNTSFKPIVQLSVVEVKTGEEDEKVLFCERGKLYRFDSGKNEMKERGMGEMKILQHKSTNACRILMRREQVLKICANHHITSQIELKPHSSASNAFIWSVMDFADGEAKHETLCIRFKTDEQANNFAKIFNEAKEKSNAKKTNDTSSIETTSTNDETKSVSNDNDDDDVISIGEVKPSAEQIDRAKKFQLPSTFYLYENKDPCKGCPGCEEDSPPIVSNENQTTIKSNQSNKTDSKSLASQTPTIASLLKTPLSSSENTIFSFKNADKSQPQLQKQTSKQEKTSVDSAVPTTPTQTETKPLIFGNFTGNSGTEMFGSSTPLNNSTTVFGSGATFSQAAGTTGGFSFPGFGNNNGTNASTSNFSFSTPAATSSTANTSSTFSFGANNDKTLFGNTPKFSFADVAKQTANDKPVSNGTEQRVFAGQGSLIFGTGAQVNTSTTGNNRDDDEGEGGGGEDESYEPNVSFKPIVQLSVVEVKTGEEDENVLFCERGKLYRFDSDTNQMKERGVGEMKILQHKTTNICRILMRREQVLKLCANHKIISQMELKPHAGTEHAFVWSAMDFSDGETKHETFCIRYKSKEIANRFLKQFNDAKQINANVQQ